MSIAYFAVGMVIGAIGGIIIYRRFARPGMDVETALELLKSKGYWVRLNIDPKGVKHDIKI